MTEPPTEPPAPTEQRADDTAVTEPPQPTGGPGEDTTTPPFFQAPGDDDDDDDDGPTMAPCDCADEPTEAPEIPTPEPTEAPCDCMDEAPEPTEPPVESWVPTMAPCDDCTDAPTEAPELPVEPSGPTMAPCDNCEEDMTEAQESGPTLAPCDNCEDPDAVTDSSGPTMAPCEDCSEGESDPCQGCTEAALVQAPMPDDRWPVDGKTAPLDEIGFRSVTELCCPPEMEAFFNRLLESMSLRVCSKSHVQGLMHWFTCVPEMDLSYMVDVVLNGKPCRYWAGTDADCPDLTEECQGHWCR